MSYTLNFVVTFENQSGLTLNAALYDAANPTPAQIGPTITTGFTDYGEGSYGFWATLPDGHVGSFVMWDSAQPSRRYAFAINPQEVEYSNVRISDLNNLSIANVEFALDDYGAARQGDLSDFIGTGGANLTAIGDTRLAHLDADVSSLATPANVTSAQTAITDAISALNDTSATDVVTALMAYAVESGKDYATVLKEVYAVLRGKYIADNADPTQIDFYAPDGTTIRVTQTLTDTTRTPS